MKSCQFQGAKLLTPSRALLLDPTGGKAPPDNYIGSRSP